MLKEFFPLVFVLLSSCICHNYIIQYESHKRSCPARFDDRLWIRCVIEDFNPQQFISPTPLSSLTLDLIPRTIKNLTLPNHFLVETSRTDDFLVHSSIQFNESLIRIDTTFDSSLEQLTILNDTFINLFFSKIHLVVADCSQPVLNIDRYAFQHQHSDNVFITFLNGTRSVRLKEYISEYCLFNEMLFFLDDLEPTRILLIKSNQPFEKKFFHPTRMITNGILLIILLFITLLLICIQIRQETKCNFQRENSGSRRTSSSNDTTRTGTISTVLSTSESSHVASSWNVQ